MRLFRYVTRKFPAAILRDGKARECDEMYVDMTAVIHAAARNLQQKQTQTRSGGAFSEEDVIAASVAYVERLAAEMFSPAERLFVAADGVSPRAKMQARRVIAHQNRCDPRDPLLEGRWSSNAVTPGTAFMERADAALAALEDRLMARNAARHPPRPAFVATVSQSSSAAECDPTGGRGGCGVAKMFREVREAREAGEAGEAGETSERGRRIVIVGGMDDEVLLMAMAEYAGARPGFYATFLLLLVRDPPGERSTLVDIGSLTAGVAHGVMGAATRAGATEFAALVTLVGNSAVPTLPSLDDTADVDGIDALVGIYKECIRTDERLLGGGPAVLGGLNVDLLRRILGGVASGEGGVPGWRNRYHVAVLGSADHGFVHQKCEEFVTMVAWSVSYLLRGVCLSDGMYYDGTHAPTALNLYNALSDHLERIVSAADRALRKSSDDCERARAAARVTRAEWQMLMILPACDSALVRRPHLRRAIVTDVAHTVAGHRACRHALPLPLSLPTIDVDLLSLAIQRAERQCSAHI